MIHLKQGDKVAVVSLSAGTLGESFCSHQLTRGIERLESFGLEVVFMPHALKGIGFVKDHPEKRAEDLVAAFQDESIKGIVCAIGGDDTFRIAPYILTEENKEIIRKHPKFFMGYSDTTINHMMLQQLGVPSYYGLSFLTCFAEMGENMLPYSEAAFQHIFTMDAFDYQASEVWYEERTDFSIAALGTERVMHQEVHGFELLQGESYFAGKLIGGCVESFYDLLAGERYPEEVVMNQRYNLFPSESQLEGAILFLETSEEKPKPDHLKDMLERLKEQGLFNGINGLLFGKPQNEMYYEEYKAVLTEVLDDTLSILYNVNIGHAYPKMLLQYGAHAEVDAHEKRIKVARL